MDYYLIMQDILINTGTIYNIYHNYLVSTCIIILIIMYLYKRKLLPMSIFIKRRDKF